MTAKDVQELVSTVGFPIVVALFFMWRDYRFTRRQTLALDRLSIGVAVLAGLPKTEEESP